MTPEPFREATLLIHLRPVPEKGMGFYLVNTRDGLAYTDTLSGERRSLAGMKERRRRIRKLWK